MAIKKKKKKLIIAASSVLVLGIITVFAVRGAAVGGAGHPVVAANALVRKDLRNTVNVTGNVESTDKTKVYTRLQYPVLEVFAEVGDLVKAGDILCQLDTKDLVNAIASNEASLQNSRTTANTQLSDAQRTLSNAQNPP
ncbi:MAG: HlyD family secretion protein, partial [Oscillospiraceae bacterium]|nr:HlyD family secretion protein [Oscillospiraceae bacterium]